MSYEWPSHGITLEYFSESEFDHPELMDVTFLRDLDTLRMRCGFALKIHDDARTSAEHDALYASSSSKPTDSAHLYMFDYPVRAVDIAPAEPTEERQLRLTYEILRFWHEGRWPHLGLGCETAHWHIDDTPRLAARRPAYWVDVSK